jgi:hypothetical protein
MNDLNKDPLLDALKRLPREVHPDHDLWSGIAQEISIDKPRARVALTRWAAAFVGIAVAASLSYYALRPTSQLQPQTAQVTPVAPTWFRAELTSVTLGPAYQQARLALAKDLFQQIQRLSPEERAKVELGLKQIDDGLRLIGEALQAHPDSVLLQQLVLSAYQRELQFMQDVSATTNDALGRDAT